MKSSQEEKNAENEPQSLSKEGDRSQKPQAQSQASPHLPFPPLPDTLDLDQATRIFMAFISELNGGSLIRVKEGTLDQANQKDQESRPANGNAPQAGPAQDRRKTPFLPTPGSSSQLHEQRREAAL